MKKSKGMSPPYQFIAIHDSERWDSFVGAHTSGHLLQSWAWGELKAGAGWHPLRLAWMDTRQGDIAAAAQVLLRAPLHLPYRLGNLAYIPRGPVLDWSCEAHAGQAKRLFFAQLLAVLRSQGAVAVQVELPQARTTGVSGNAEASSAINLLRSMGFRPARPVQPSRSILVDLTSGEDTLLAAMKEKWRYNVRLAARKGVVVRPAHSLEDVRAWYRILQVTGRRDAFGIHTFEYYQRAWQLFAPRNQAQLLLAEHDGRLLAGIFVGCMARQAIYLYGASSNERRQLMPNYLLQWEAMRWARSQGAHVYDLWGIPDTDDPGEAMSGVYRFKSGWGGQVVSFAGNYEYVCRPTLMRLARRFMHQESA